MQEAAIKINKNERSYDITRLPCWVLTLKMFSGEKLQRRFRRWLSAPDPWSNHNIARRAHHTGTATWFTEGNIFEEWKTTSSMLWIHGKREYLSLTVFFWC